MNNSFDQTSKAIWTLIIQKTFRLSKKELFSAGIVFFLMTQAIMASGTIKGKVIDKETKEGLTGANVIVKNTSLGAASDFNGNFTIYNVPDGEQSVSVSYIGYATTELQVTITDKQISELEFVMEPKALTGETVIITAQAQGQIQAINQQISSDKIVSIVSEARIQELPDFNAAAAISRLPGVSTTSNSGEAQKVVIRGLAPQYNAVAVGGISLASTGSTQIGATSLPGLTAGTINNDRSADLTMVTPYMLKSIEVYKTLTPDMEANVIGGYVNMELREAPSGLHGDLLLQSGYTGKTNNYGNYRVVLSASNRFLREKLGLYLLGNVESYDRNSDNMSAGYENATSFLTKDDFHTVRVTNVTLNRHLETRKRYGVNLILDYLLPSGSIKMVNMFSRLNSNNQDFRTVLNYNSPNHNIDHTYQERDNNTDLAVNSLEFQNDFKFISVNIKAANTYSMNRFPLAGFYRFFQNNALVGNSTTGDTNIVPENLTHFANYDSDTLTLLSSTSLFASIYHENNQVYKSDFKIPVNFGKSISGFFKFGGEYKYSLRTNDQSTPYVTINRGGGTPTGINADVINYINSLYPNLRYSSTGPLMGTNFTSTDPKLTNSFLGNRFGSIYWAPDPAILNRIVSLISQNPLIRAYNDQGGWFDGPYQELPNDYKYIEKYYAGFLMTQIDIGTRFMLVGGARYEETRGLFDAYNLRDERNPRTQPYTFVSSPSWNHYWLPMIQSKYDFAEWGDVRYSYTQTLARPDYSQLSPHYSIASGSTPGIFAGNPNLKPAQAYNHDLLLTIHNNTLGLLSLGGFYKEVNKFTYSAVYRAYAQSDYDKFGITDLLPVEKFGLPYSDRGSILRTFINSPYKAYVKGAEIDLQTRFWYLRAPFNGVVFGVNYTHVWSKASYPIYDVKAARGVVSWYADSTRDGRLIFQPDDIVNAYLGYDYKGFSGRVSCVFQGNSVTGIGEFAEQDGFSRDYFRVDISMRQMLPWKGLQLFLDASNLNNETNQAAQRSIGGFTSENDYGFVVNLGVRYIL